MGGKRSPNYTQVAWAATGEEDYEVSKSKVKMAALFLAGRLTYEEVLVHY